MKNSEQNNQLTDRQVELIERLRDYEDTIRFVEAENILDPNHKDYDTIIRLLNTDDYEDDGSVYGILHLLDMDLDEDMQSISELIDALYDDAYEYYYTQITEEEKDHLIKNATAIQCDIVKEIERVLKGIDIKYNTYYSIFETKDKKHWLKQTKEKGGR